MLIPLIFRLLLGANSLVTISGVRFVPETGGLQYSKLIEPLPTEFDVAASQNAIGASFWSSSFIHASNGQDYLILSHAISSLAQNVYRSSILDIGDPSVYHQWSEVHRPGTNFTSFDFETDGFYMGLASPDLLGPIKTWSNRDEVSFNLTYNLSAPIILNSGVGGFQWTAPAVTYEWSMPAGLTTGSLVVNGKTVTVDPAKSFTWYDRQWGTGVIATWTWFELHLDTGGLGTKLSVWFYPSGDGSTTTGFATVSDRHTPGINVVVPAEFTKGNRAWSSPFGGDYHLDWTLRLADGMTLHVSSIRDDQELADPQGLFRAYEGYVKVVGTSKKGPVSGYGLAEIQLPLNR